MNNEPVAWMLVDPNWNDFCRYSSYPTRGAIPLYTHPVKELTDEEIMDCIEDKTGYSFNACDEDLLDFARAILRKAQCSAVDLTTNER